MPLIAIRKAHVKRVFSDDQSAYVDMLRIDEYATVANAGSQSTSVSAGDITKDLAANQGALVTLRWQDGPETSMQEGFNQNRTYDTIKIANPGNAGQVVSVKAIKTMKMKDSIDDQQQPVLTFKNTIPDSQNHRVVYSKRIVNASVDASIDMTAQTPDWPTYLAALGSQDTSQYVDAEIVKRYAFMTSIEDQQLSITSLNSGTIASLFADTPDGATLAPVRLDPFQFVVNVSWQANYLVIYLWGLGYAAKPVFKATLSVANVPGMPTITLFDVGSNSFNSWPAHDPLLAPIDDTVASSAGAVVWTSPAQQKSQLFSGPSSPAVSVGSDGYAIINLGAVQALLPPGVTDMTFTLTLHSDGGDVFTFAGAGLMIIDNIKSFTRILGAMGLQINFADPSAGLILASQEDWSGGNELVNWPSGHLPFFTPPGTDSIAFSEGEILSGTTTPYFGPIPPPGYTDLGGNVFVQYGAGNSVSLIIASGFGNTITNGTYIPGPPVDHLYSVDVNLPNQTFTVTPE